MQRRWWLIAGAVGLVVIAYLLWPRPYCSSAQRAYGIKVPICPDGRVRQRLRIMGSRLRRGGKGRVDLRAHALYTVAQADSYTSAVIPELSAELFLVDAKGKETALKPQPSPTKPREAWQRGWGSLSTNVTLPATLHDGDYKLRAKVKTKVGAGQVDLPLALYAPARIHVLTDRPLYEPGHRVQFRALAVRARDLAPLDHRPGKWTVRDPQGHVLLEEKTPAGPWGVAAGNFLIDKEAPTGIWTIRWESGKAHGTATVKVEPFTLPRFRVSATPQKSFYRAGEVPRIRGSVVYSSGAPVQKAKLQLSWSARGAWPPPSSWLDEQAKKETLPRSAETDDAGRFTLDLPEIPKDLQGQVTLAARIAAVDPAGDRVEGAVSVLLSRSAISVKAFTPLARGGLVAGANNRLYLRVTRADGAPLPGATISVTKAWRADGEGIKATLDADSVARIQLDPGAPVNVIIPPRPVRASRRRQAPVERLRSYDLIGRHAPPLADQVELDRWLALLQPCAKWSHDGAREARFAISVAPSGAIGPATAKGRLGRCALERVRRRRLPKGKSRLYGLTFRLAEPKLPRLQTSLSAALDGDLPEGLQELVNTAARDARDCLPTGHSGALPQLLSWRLAPKANKATFRWVKDPNVGHRMPAAMEGCILSRLNRYSLDEAAKTSHMGVLRYEITSTAGKRRRRRASPTIMKGYELLVSTLSGDKVLGQIKLRMRPGRIPRLQVRAEPVLAKAGETVTIRLLRGPGFRRRLPRSIVVTHFGTRRLIKLPKHIKKAGTYRYKLPKGKKGWFSFSALGQRALVFVRSTDDLSVAVKPEKNRYAPGKKATLLLQTRLGQRGAKAAVGLFGVDESLAQLVPLPGADELRGLRPKIAMKSKAFDLLDAQALALGRIRGAFAAEATVLKVSKVPKPEQLDVVINGSAYTRFDPNTELTDRFYTVLAELHRQARTWEKSAPKTQKMTPKQMALLWNKALDACLAKDKNIVDAFGRRLRLHRLPADLLALTDPRQVVSEGTRLPEDIENWSAWVRRRKP